MNLRKDHYRSWQRRAPAPPLSARTTPGEAEGTAPRGGGAPGRRRQLLLLLRPRRSLPRGCPAPKRWVGACVRACVSEPVRGDRGRASDRRRQEAPSAGPPQPPPPPRDHTPSRADTTHPPPGSVRSHTRTPPFSLGPEAGRGLPAARARPARSATKGKRRGGARVSPAGMSPLSGGPDLGTQTPQRGAAASPWPPSARLRVPNSPLPSGERRGV